MNYVKKMCILRQIKHGFSGDGKALSGLIKAEQYGKNLAVEVSIINFAPIVSGEYYCLLSDGKGKTEMLALRGKSIFNILSDLDISEGFCGIICYVKNEVVPVAFGINGNGAYDWKSILNATLPPVFPRGDERISANESAKNSAPVPKKEEKDGGRYELNDVLNEKPLITPSTSASYNDEAVAIENYYEESEHERKQPKKIDDYAYAESAAEKQSKETRGDLAKNVDAKNVRHSFTTNSDGYYASVKSEIDELFKQYPRDKTLDGAFTCSQWVRVKGEASAPEYLVGVLYNDGKATYICYALAAKDKRNPPSEIKDSCVFVPTSPYDDESGFFVIFQSAATGECIKPDRI